MRPDEHKRKKNAQYKKKHGLEKSRGKGEKEKSDSQQHKSGASSSNALAETTLSDKETGYEIDPKFSKRPVIQTVDKFDPSDSSEDDLNSQVDLETLLQSAGGPESYMKLPEEKEWDIQEELDETFSIDTKELAESYRNLSFCEMFGIKPEDLKSESTKGYNIRRDQVENENDHSFISLATKAGIEIPWSCNLTHQDLTDEYPLGPRSTSSDAVDYSIPLFIPEHWQKTKETESLSNKKAKPDKGDSALKPKNEAKPKTPQKS
uniref:Uncharacterized protein n=1 Tax=Ciona savignyi TaxID=51511 RepID=H2YSL6_CIOSA